MGTSRCFICLRSNEDDHRLKLFNDKTWATMKKMSALRQNLVSDKYADVTRRVGRSNIEESTLHYHPSCRNTYSAVKRPRESPSSSDASTVSKNPCIETRRESKIPKFDQQGLLKGSCVFCGKARKKRGGKEEPRFKIATWVGCQSISERVRLSTNERIKTLVWNNVDLIAKEAKYHKTCRAVFLKEIENHVTVEGSGEGTSHSLHQHHNNAFVSIYSYIQKEIIEG